MKVIEKDGKIYIDDIDVIELISSLTKECDELRQKVNNAIEYIKENQEEKYIHEFSSETANIIKTKRLLEILESNNN